MPEYYNQFRCSASACIHNCCSAGWEIDLDDGTVKKYRKWIGEEHTDFSEKLKNGIFVPTIRQRKEGALPCIRMDRNGCCPFLNTEHLCSLILQKGNNALCRICRDHPRFRNYYPDHVETGLGMCCEEAVRLIFAAETFRYTDPVKGTEETPEYMRRGGKERTVGYFSREINFGEWLDWLGTLEQLDPDWSQLLRKAKNADGGFRTETPETYCLPGGVLDYLLFRHYCSRGPAFVGFCWRLLNELCDRTGTEAGEICRLFSEEIEYSEENTEAIAGRLEALYQ